MNDLLTVEEDRGVLLATLNRPNKGNALNQPLIDAIDDFCAEVEARAAAGEPRTIVLTGAGEKAFCAGADVTELDGISADQARAQMLRGQQVFDRLERLPVAVIGAINGFALGGGLELAMSTDFRVAHPSARVGQPEISLGNIPGWGGTQRLPALVGRGLATEMILTGDLITAQRAYEIGLVNAVNDDPLEWATDKAQRIAQNNPVAVSGAKVAIRTGLEAGMAQGLVVEADAVADCCDTDVQKAAVRAFLDRRSRRS
ncbi:enoyl-CoA hydratase/isomerase family protein [Nocardioides astragali]|uniref:Enoyl-CoA hydratase/isomerase family protein n=1 Tax=Nocardioides astragali TaxID=1776736 RepID=A0ABW2NC08_9ACTN|nr:enoyl-CoA hydratase-related protein [Nocardioides astragali]